jgi:hypothetical protein
MIFKLLVAGALGAGLLYSVQYVLNPPASGCGSCAAAASAQLMQTLGTGFAVGAGVQLGVMLMGVS